MISRTHHSLYAVKAPLAALKNNGNLLNVTGQLINIGTSVCLIGYGAKEIILDSHPAWFRITPSPESSPAVQKTVKAVDWLLMAIRNHPANLADKVRFTTHGLLMIGTGAAGTVSAIDRLGWISVGSSLRLFDFTSAGLFMIGNIIYLEYNIEKFVEATNQLKAPNANKKTIIMQQVATAIGIVSNLSYIAASMATLVSAPFLYPLILGLIGVVTGSIRILLESYVAWAQEQLNSAQSR